jgi:serine/threonine protein kinase
MEKYRLDDEIGTGSFGVVYRAHRRSDGYPVAIKVIQQPTYEWDEVMDLREGT